MDVFTFSIISIISLGIYGFLTPKNLNYRFLKTMPTSLHFSFSSDKRNGKWNKPGLLSAPLKGINRWSWTWLSSFRSAQVELRSDAEDEPRDDSQRRRRRERRQWRRRRRRREQRVNKWGKDAGRTLQQNEQWPQVVKETLVQVQTSYLAAGSPY